MKDEVKKAIEDALTAQRKLFLLLAEEADPGDDSSSEGAEAAASRIAGLHNKRQHGQRASR